jgi:antitoxin component YwqK of YwqJK toxin-antitoxin module
MQKTLFILLMLAAFCANAQVDTFNFKGKKYLVYPYQLEGIKEVKPERVSLYYRLKYGAAAVAAAPYEESYDDNEGGIPPIFDSIPSGNYVLLQSPDDTRKNRWRKHFRKLSPNVRAEFFIENGKINGPAILYLKTGVVDKEISYQDGLKHGECRNIYFVDDTTYANITNYKMGLLDGPFKSYEARGKKVFLSYEGSYKGGILDGWYKSYSWNEDMMPYLSEEYFIVGESLFSKHYLAYYENGQLMMEAHPDSTTSGFDNEQPPYTYFTDSMYKQKTKKGKEEEIIVSPSFYASFTPYQTSYFCYHENGRLLGKFSYDTLSSEVQFDTVFTSSGKPAIVRTALPDTNGHKRFSISHFMPNGEMTNQNLYACDSSGFTSIYQSSEANAEGKQEITSADYSLIFKSDWKKTSKDSLLLTGIRLKDNKVIYEYESPLMDHQKFVRSKDQFGESYSLDFKITNYDTAHAAYQSIFTCGKGKAVLHTFRDESPMAEKRISSGKLFQRILRTRKSDKIMDSLVVYYDGLPYTGPLEIRASSKKAVLIKKSNKLIINPLMLSSKELGRKEKFFLKGSFIRMQFKNGQIQNADLRFQSMKFSVRAHSDFKNSLPQGKVYGRMVQRSGSGKIKKDETIEAVLNEGLLDGKMKEWSIGEKNHKKYLKHESTYSMGLSIDTAFYYRENGKLWSQNVFNKEGKRNGPQYSYDEKGNVQNYFYFENGKQEGISYHLNEIGDTIYSANYLNDSLEGKYYAASIDYPEYIVLNKIYANFKRGKLCGKFIYTDGFNVKRLLFNVDSSRVYSLESYQILSNWESELAFAGEANIFHPNGKLYAQGKMKMNPEVKLDYDQEMYEDGDYAVAEEVEYSPMAALGMRKTGLWNYYNSVGRKQAEMNYADTTYVIGKDTLSSGIAAYKGYYDNGKLKYIGVLLSEAPMENCESDLNELEFTADYSLYISPKGDTLVKNGKGKLQTFNHDGGLKTEGEINHAKKQGWWKEYNKEGKLISAGQYTNGKKNGRWLSGDLTGLNYLDGGCYESEEIKKQVANAVKYEIEIEEVIYEDDVEKSKQTYSFNRSVE